MRRYLTVSTVLLAMSLVPAAAQGALGDQLAKFKPPHSGNGRGIEVVGGSTAVYTTTGGENNLFKVNLQTQADLGTVSSGLGALSPGRTYGALTWDGGNGVLWGAEFNAGSGRVDRIDPNGGAVARLAGDVSTLDLQLTGVDGLARDADGTFYVSGDGINYSAADPSKIYHVDADLNQIGAFISAGFGNSGIVLDGNDMWLANYNGKRIHRFTKAGADTGFSFAVDAEVEPEDLAIDNCSFTGKKAIWTHSAGTGGAYMAAYEIGTSDNAGCPAPKGPETITIGDGTGKPIYAGQPIWLDATSPYDPTGTIFIYIWLFGDYHYNINKPRVAPTLNDTVQDKGKVQHTFQCAGFYAPKVTVIDETGARKEVSKDITVQFSKKATKKHGRLKVSPKLVASQTRAKISLKVKKLKKGKKKRRAKIKSILYKLDGKKLGKRKKPKKAVIAKIKRAGPHTLQIDVKFKGPRGKKRIKECFQLS